MFSTGKGIAQKVKLNAGRFRCVVPGLKLQACVHFSSEVNVQGTDTWYEMLYQAARLPHGSQSLPRSITHRAKIQSKLGMIYSDQRRTRAHTDV